MGLHSVGNFLMPTLADNLASAVDNQHHCPFCDTRHPAAAVLKTLRLGTLLLQRKPSSSHGFDRDLETTYSTMLFCARIVPQCASSDLATSTRCVGTNLERKFLKDFSWFCPLRVYYPDCLRLSGCTLCTFYSLFLPVVVHPLKPFVCTM